MKATDKDTGLTAERVRELLSYDPDTGVLRWKVRASGRKMDKEAGSTYLGYRSTCVQGREYKNHRLAWIITYGVWPKHQIDHINGVRDDNRLENLRDVAPIVNLQNRHNAPVNNLSTGLLGVDKVGNRFRAAIMAEGKRRHIGLFKTALEAHEAYLKEKRRLHKGCTI